MLSKRTNLVSITLQVPHKMPVPWTKPAPPAAVGLQGAPPETEIRQILTPITKDVATLSVPAHFKCVFCYCLILETS